MSVSVIDRKVLLLFTKEFKRIELEEVSYSECIDPDTLVPNTSLETPMHESATRAEVRLVLSVTFKSDF